MGVLVRAQVEADWPAVLAILDEVARAGETYAMDVPATPADGRAFWSGAALAVAEVDGVVVGAAKMGPNRPAQGAHVGTASFVVSSSARGHGVGRALGEHVVSWHREHGFRGIQFNAVVETNTAAVRLWHSLGFETVGVVPEAFRRPGGDLVGLHVMHLSLAPGPRVHLTRDSVAMGDDVLAPHAHELELRPGATVADLLDHLAHRPYLASVVGGSTWVVRVGPPGTRPACAVGVVTRDPDAALVVGDGSVPVPDGSVARADYLLAQDPEATAALVAADPWRRVFRLG